MGRAVRPQTLSGDQWVTVGDCDAYRRFPRATRAGLAADERSRGFAT